MSYPMYYSPETKSDNTTGVVKRRRAALACTSCRRRKIRCDVGQPACGHCLKTGLECMYDDSKRRRTHREVTDAEPHTSEVNLDRRLKHVESMLTTLMEKQGIFNKEADHDLGDSDSSLDSDSASDHDSDDQNDGKVDDRPSSTKTDLYNLAERRGASHAEEKESADLATANSIYSHGVTTAVLTPTCMRWLCTRVGNPELGKEAEGLLSWLWRQKAVCEWPIKVQQIPDLDMDILRYCVDQYRKCKAMPLKALLNNDDVDAAIIACNGELELNRVNMDSPYALVFSTIIMLVTNDVRIHRKLGPYSVTQAVEQNRLAFLRGTRIASNLFMSHSTVLLLRLLVAFVYMMSYRAMLSQLRSLGSLALTMASTLGLQREETSRHLSPDALKRRKILWVATRNIDITLSLFLFQQPLVNPTASMSLTRVEWESEDAFWPVQQREYLSRLYMKAYQKVFSIEARKTSVHRLLRYILKYDSKLTQWKEGLPSQMQDPVAVTDEIARLYSSTVDENGRELEPHELIDLANKPLNMVFTFICYYHILILLHSIPALTPSSLEAFSKKEGRLPERLQDSLEVISHSARMLLALISHGRGVITEALAMYLASNAFCVLFLKQIRQPRHPTNSDDVLLFYRFITEFRKQTAEPNSTMTGDISRSVNSAWLILANAVSELNRKYQPSLPKNIQDEIRQAEEEALDGFESPFPNTILHRRTRMQPVDPPRAVEPQVFVNKEQHPNVPLIPSQLVSFFTSELRPPQLLPLGGSPQSVPSPNAQLSPLNAAPPPPVPAATGYSPLIQQHVPQLPLPTPQHTPPQAPQSQALPPIQSTGPPGIPPFNHPGMVSNIGLDTSKVGLNRLNQNQDAVNSAQCSGNTELNPNSRWGLGAQPGIIQPPRNQAYSLPSDENSLWDAFNGVRNRQSNVYEQAMQSVPVENTTNEFADDCVIA